MVIFLDENTRIEATLGEGVDGTPNLLGQVVFEVTTSICGANDRCAVDVELLLE